MNTITLPAISVEVETTNGMISTLLFHTLTEGQFIVSQNGQPEYFLDMNSKEKPLVQDILGNNPDNKSIEQIIEQLGFFLGYEWTIHNPAGENVIEETGTVRSITLSVLEDMADLYMELYFVATDEPDIDTLMDEDKFFQHYVVESDELLVERFGARNRDELLLLLSLLFNQPVNIAATSSPGHRQLFDLTPYKQDCINKAILDEKYEQWILDSKRQNTMSEYGNILCVTGIINNNLHKRYLFLIIEKRRHWHE